MAEFVTDGGGIFRSDWAKVVYRALGIEKEEIERGQPWQSFIETNFNLQRRLADHFFAKAETWEELVGEHDLWLERHNRPSACVAGPGGKVAAEPSDGHEAGARPFGPPAGPRSRSRRLSMSSRKVP